MPKLSDIGVFEVAALQSKIEKSLLGVSSLEDASQKFAGVFYEEFAESLVLARVFATIPFMHLPSDNQHFAANLADSKGGLGLVNGHTLVLSLLGTRGEAPEWNDRRKTKGHVGIPLISKDFLDAIPMMSRLLKELGVEVGWIDRDDTKIVIKRGANKANVFYVPDAKTAIDHENRKIISAQDFVESHNVKTVFGFGNGYSGADDIFMVAIFFANEKLEKKQVEQFTPMINLFKTATTAMIHQRKLFS